MRAHNCEYLPSPSYTLLMQTSPGAMALAASGSPQLAAEVTAATGKELRVAGINWV